MADLDRIYDILQRQGETLARIDQSQQDTRERLFGANGQPGALHFLQTEISGTNEIVAKHGKQIQFWRGAMSIISLILTTALAWGGIVLGKHR
jgi:hypothetical protein